MCGGEGEKERGVHRVSGLVGPAECSPYYGTLSPSLSLPHSFRSSFLPSFPPCPLSFSTTSILLCTVPMPRLSLSLSLSSLPVQILYNRGFAIRLLCRSRATGFSLYFEHYVYKRVYVQNRTCIYIYVYIRIVHKNVYMFFLFCPIIQ